MCNDISIYINISTRNNFISGSYICLLNKYFVLEVPGCLGNALQLVRARGVCRETDPEAKRFSTKQTSV